MSAPRYQMPDEIRRELEILPQCLVVFYMDGTRSRLPVLVSDLSCQVMHQDRESLLAYFSQNPEHYIHPDDLIPLQSRLTELRRRSDYVFPFRMRVLVDHAYRWFKGNMSARFLTEDSFLLYVSSSDITDDHNRHKKVKIRELLLSRVLDTTQNCMFWKDTDRRFVGVNQAFLDYYGFPSEDVLIGKNDEDMGWHPDPEPYKNDELRVLRGESTHMVHGTCLVHGEVRDILATKTPVYDDNEIIGLVGSFIDVTDHYRQQHRIEQLSMELEAALHKEKHLNSEMNHFLSRLSHELRTPMNAVIGLSALGMEQTTLGGAVSYLEKIHASGQYLLQIINEVLEINKLESGDYRLNEEPSDLLEIYEDIRTILAPLAESSGIHLVLDETGIRFPDVCCDRVRVQQILINLLNNAVKFTDRGGKVSLSASQTEEEDAIRTVFEVSDTGCGISPAFMPRLFQPFAQENRNPSKYGTGTGLGLVISRNFASLMGGDITVESTEGVGSVFTVTLFFKKTCPLPSKETAPADSAPPSYEDLSGLRILLAEDNLINQEVAVGVLARIGIQVDLAANGSEALRMFVQSAPGCYDAILMDIQMPYMNGFDAARAIRSQERPDRNVPIIAMSADIFDASRNAARDCGMNGYVTKPLDMDVLYLEIRNALRK